MKTYKQKVHEELMELWRDTVEHNLSMVQALVHIRGAFFNLFMGVHFSQREIRELITYTEKAVHFTEKKEEDSKELIGLLKAVLEKLSKQ